MTYSSCYQASQAVAKPVMAAMSWDQIPLLLQDQDIAGQVSFLFAAKHMLV